MSAGDVFSDVRKCKVLTRSKTDRVENSDSVEGAELRQNSEDEERESERVHQLDQDELQTRNMMH